MDAHIRSAKRAILSFAAVTFALAPILGSAQTASGDSVSPTTKEVEFWRSVERLNVDEAYQAYLQEFPTGTYAQLARIALAKIRTDSQATSAQTAPAKYDSSRLKALRLAPRKTDAVDYENGSRFIGPGTLTVGYWGAKRQVLLPAGEWIAVAGEEHELIGITTLQLATIAFAKLSGPDVIEQITITFNRRSPSPQANSASAGITNTPRWPHASSCDSGVPDAIHRLKDSDMRTQWCAAIRPLKGTTDSSWLSPTLQASIATSLETLGAQSTGFNYLSEYHISDRTGAFISYVHLQRRLLAPILVDTNFENADIAVPENASPNLKASVLQLAHFAYHASMAFQRQYASISLSEGAPLNAGYARQILSRVP